VKCESCECCFLAGSQYINAVTATETEKERDRLMARLPTCKQVVEWDHYDTDDPYAILHACSEHIAEMLTDAREQAVIAHSH
jgi:hypothetical protein